MESIGVATLNLLEAIRFANRKIRFYSAGSSECFGDAGDVPSDESTAFRPRSPYAAAKATAFWEVANYREAYGLFACTGIQIGRAHVCTPVTNAHLVCRLLLEKKKP